MKLHKKDAIIITLLLILSGIIVYALVDYQISFFNVIKSDFDIIIRQAEIPLKDNYILSDITIKINEEEGIKIYKLPKKEFWESLGLGLFPIYIGYIFIGIGYFLGFFIFKKLHIAIALGLFSTFLGFLFGLIHRDIFIQITALSLFFFVFYDKRLFS